MLLCGMLVCCHWVAGTVLMPAPALVVDFMLYELELELPPDACRLR